MSLLTTTEVTQRLRVTKHTIRDWVQAGKLRPALRGREYLFNEKQIEALENPQPQQARRFFGGAKRLA